MRNSNNDDYVRPLFLLEGASATGSVLRIARDFSHMEIPIRLEFYLYEKKAREQRVYAKKKRKNRAYKKMLNKHKKSVHKPKGSYVRSLNR